MTPPLTPDRAVMAGLRVVDLTTMIFGPWAAQMLADYGAEVIKVETPDGDGTRAIGPAAEPAMASVFLGANRNKKSVVLDLKTEAGAAAMRALIASADVFMHNVRPQSLARLGLSPQALSDAHPRLVVASLNGFAEDGPYAGAPAYDDIIQALSGAADLMLRRTGEPAYMPTIVADKVCALTAVQAILAALLQRERTGRGQALEVPMLESMTAFVLVEHFYARHRSAAGQPQAGELGYPRTMSPSRRPYRTADGHVCLMPYSDENWRRFLAAIGHAELAQDPRFARLEQRSRHIDELLPVVEAVVARQTNAHWLALCRELDIPCAPINRLQDLETDPHLRAVGLFQTVAGADGQACRVLRSPVRLPRNQVPLSAPPQLGADTAQVLASLSLPDEVRSQLTNAGESPTATPG